MKDLRISLVQGETRWHDPAGNRDYYGDLIAPLRGMSDLVLLPETFTSGFSNEAIDQAETTDGATATWLREQAARLGAAICGSAQIRDGQGVFNRLFFVTPDGAASTYDKRHLFRYAKEHERYAAGRDRLTVEWQGWLPSMARDTFSWTSLLNMSRSGDGSTRWSCPPCAPSRASKSAASCPASWFLRPRIKSIEQFTAIRWSHVLKFARDSKRPNCRYALRKVSWTTSSASWGLPVIRCARR